MRAFKLPTSSIWARAPGPSARPCPAGLELSRRVPPRSPFLPRAAPPRPPPPPAPRRNRALSTRPCAIPVPIIALHVLALKHTWRDQQRDGRLPREGLAGGPGEVCLDRDGAEGAVR